MRYSRRSSTRTTLVVLVAVLSVLSNVPISDAIVPGDPFQTAPSPRATTGLAQTPWPMYRHDLNHTGRSQFDTSHNSGHQKWYFDTMASQGCGVSATPAIGPDGMIYFVSEFGYLYAITSNGTYWWELQVDDMGGSSAAIGSDGTLFFGSTHETLFAYRTDGTLRWRTHGGPGAASSPAIGPDGTVYIGAFDGKLHAFTSDGREKWNFTTGSFVSSSPAVGPDGTVYVGSDDKSLYAIEAPGLEKWSFPTGGGVYSSPALGIDGTVYFGSYDHKLYALYPNGTQRWNFTAGDNIDSSPAIGPDGTIYFGSWDHRVYALYPNGTKRWSFLTGDQVSSSPAIGSDGTIFIGSYDDNIYTLRPDGTKRWDFTLKGWVHSSPVIGSDGTVYIADLSSGVYALGDAVPGEPRGLTAKALNSKVVLGWFPPDYFGTAEISNYTIYRGTAPGKEVFLARVGKVLNFTDTSVSNGKAYYYRVTATNAVGEGPRSNEASVIPGRPPAAPRGFAAKGHDGQVDLNWTAPSDDGGAPITNYTVYRNGTLLASLDKVLSYNDTNLKNGVHYWYDVSASNDAGEGPRCAGMMSYAMTVPSEPAYINVVGGARAITVLWSPPEYDGGSPVLGYNLYRAPWGAPLALLVEGYNGTRYNDSAVVQDIYYVYVVRAVNAAGEGPASYDMGNGLLETPRAPLLSLRAGAGNITLSWTAAYSLWIPVTNYTIYRGMAEGNETFYVMIGPRTNWTDSNVTEGTLYYYRVSGTSEAGEGKLSLGRNITMLPGVPKGFHAAAGNGYANLNWTGHMGLGSSVWYRIYRSEAKDGYYILVANITWTQYKDVGLRNDHIYWYKVCAGNPYGSSENTTAVRARPYKPTIGNVALYGIVIVLVVIVVAVVLVILFKKRRKAPAGPSSSGKKAAEEE